MTKSQFSRLGSTAVLAGAVILVGAFSTLAGAASEEQQMGHPAGMVDPSTMEPDMKSMHQEMQARMKSMDSRLADLVVEMEAASGMDKTEAIAAVVTELVAQRKAMHGMMAQMQPRMMNHMMEHMASGMMQGMKQSMTGCPMMQKTTSPEDEAGGDQHNGHHDGD